MLIDPPIDKMVDKVGCRFALVCIVSKRARALQQKIGEEGVKELKDSPISLAASDFYDEMTGSGAYSPNQAK